MGRRNDKFSAGQWTVLEHFALQWDTDLLHILLQFCTERLLRLISDETAVEIGIRFFKFCFS
jgi:hypothetical protein